MQKQNDIAALFQQFGGAPDTYREITRQEQSQEARARWPLLSQIDGARTDAVPPVRVHERLPTAGSQQQALPAPVTQARAPTAAQTAHAAFAGSAPLPASPPLFAATQASAAPVAALAPVDSLRDSRRALPRTEPTWTAASTDVPDSVAPRTTQSAPASTASPLSRLGRHTDAAPLPVSVHEHAPLNTDLLRDIFGHLARPGVRRSDA